MYKNMDIDKMSIENDITQLDDELKQIIIYAYEGYRYKEICEIMDLTYSQVSKRLAKARRFLKERHYE